MPPALAIFSAAYTTNASDAVTMILNSLVDVAATERPHVHGVFGHIQQMRFGAVEKRFLAAD
jgi:hypothetical protein